MKNRNENMKEVTLADLTFTRTFRSPYEAIEYSRQSDLEQKRKFNFDAFPIRGKVVRQFHWNEQQLVLEFEENLFLRIFIRDHDEIEIGVIASNTIETHENVSYSITWPNSWVLWRPSVIAQKYAGKTFSKVHLGQKHVYLYFENTPLLIFCTMNKNVLNGELFLTWDESE